MLNALLSAFAAWRRAKDEKSTAATGQPTFWAGAEREASDFSTRQIEQGLHGATLQAGRIIQEHSTGVRWKELWPQVLNDCLVTKSNLGRAVNEMRKEGRIQAPDWPSEKKIIPADDQLLLPVT